LLGDGTKHTSYGHTSSFDYIYIFKKDGSRQVPDDLNLMSRITMEEWKKWGFPIWQIAAKKDEDYELTLKEEISRRLIRMYSFVGDLVVDTSLRSGATLELAVKLGREVTGYEKDSTHHADILKMFGVKADEKNEESKAKTSGDTGSKTIERIASIIDETRSRDTATPAVVARLDGYEDCSEPQSDQGEEIKETDETLKPPHVGESKAMVAGLEEGVL